MALVEVASPRGFEPPAYRLGICRSILLSYGNPFIPGFKSILLLYFVAYVGKLHCAPCS